jgi:hypothetical protein
MFGNTNKGTHMNITSEFKNVHTLLCFYDYDHKISLFCPIKYYSDYACGWSVYLLPCLYN